MLIDLPTIPSSASPLGYPGGKKRLWNYFKMYLPDDLEFLISPFMGGGGIELQCTKKFIKVQASDNFEPLTNFWQQFKSNSEEVINLVCSMYPITFDERTHYHDVQLKKECKDLNGNMLSDVKRAAIYLCINKQSFRSWGLARPPSRCEELRSLDSFLKFKIWKNDYLEVLNSDYVPIIENANGKFMYLDPPYIDKEYFYGTYEGPHDFDHDHLSDLLHNTSSKWILSYGDHPKIRELYNDYTILEPKWGYSVNPGSYSNIESTELLILNL